MPAEMYLKALLLGVAIAAPVGPMALLCMRRTLARGWSLGFATGLGIATGDGLYALVAALGLAGVSHFVLAHDRMLHFAAGLFLVYLGLRTFFTDDAAAAGGRADDAGSAWSAYATSVLLTLTNPPTIVMFAAAFAALAPRGGLVPGAAPWSSARAAARGGYAEGCRRAARSARSASAASCSAQPLSEKKPGPSGSAWQPQPQPQASARGSCSAASQ
jgi:threonine/homoserine/homoserine lactone efflux protein